MKQPSKNEVNKIISRLKTKSRSINSIEQYVKLAFDFRYDNFSIEPMQNQEEIYSLLKIVSRLKLKVIVEIGTSGGGTLFLLSKIATPNSIIISIDLPNGDFGGEFYPEWKQPIYNSFATKKQKIHLLRSNSHSAKSFQKIRSILGKRKIDFLLIDGDHTYNGVKKDFEMYNKLVSKNGLIALHDINKKNDRKVKVSKFWNKIKSRHENFEIISNQKGNEFGIGFLVQSGLANSNEYAGILKELLLLKNSKISNLLDNPLSLLLQLYSERRDLQDAFPEVKKGDFKKLILWAALNLTSKNKSEKEVKYNLSKFISWFNEFQNMSEKEKHSSRLKKSLLDKQKELQSISTTLKTKDEDLRDVIKYSNELNTILESQERHRKDIENQIIQKDNDLATLDKLAAEREEYAKDLEFTIKEKDKTILALQKLSDSNDSRLNDLEKLANEREKYAKDLEVAVQDKTKTLVELERISREREKLAKDLEETLQDKEKHYLNLEELLKSKEIQFTNLTTVLNQSEQDVNDFKNLIGDKENQLIELRNTLFEIEKSLTFNILRKINSKIDVVFPSGTKRGEFKKITKEGVQMINRKGFKEYLSAVKTQVKKREFYIPSPMKITEDEKRVLIKVVQNNKKTRLELKPHSKNEIIEDEISIQDEDELI